MKTKDILGENWLVHVEHLAKTTLSVDYTKIVDTSVEQIVADVRNIDPSIRFKSIAEEGEYYQQIEDNFTVAYRLIVGFKFYVDKPNWLSEQIRHISIRYNAARKRYLDKRSKTTA